MATKRKAKSRIFTRTDRFGVTLFYGDFRDLGGGRSALKPTGKARGRATSDPDVAETLCNARVDELLKRKHSGERQTVGIEKKQTPGLKVFAAHHLNEKAKSGKFALRWLAQLEDMPTLAVQHFGEARQLDTVAPADVLAFLEWVGDRKGRRGNTSLSGGTRRHYLNAISGLYKRAQQDGHVLSGFNPAASIIDKPVGAAEEAHWLEAYEAALLLEAGTAAPTAEGYSGPASRPGAATGHAARFDGHVLVDRWTEARSAGPRTG